MKYGLRLFYTTSGVAWQFRISISSLGSKDQTSQMTLLWSTMEYWLNIPHLFRIPRLGAYLDRLGGVLKHLN